MLQTLDIFTSEMERQTIIFKTFIRLHFYGTRLWQQLILQFDYVLNISFPGILNGEITERPRVSVDEKWNVIHVTE